mmetsp:Transcript_6257/g.12520  ORF Transcript_6257/g.12520 Transcript_6257/m.12520 type:complete len:99 (-) Transcript_6257:334-630(-)
MASFSGTLPVVDRTESNAPQKSIQELHTINTLDECFAINGFAIFIYLQAVSIVNRQNMAIGRQFYVPLLGTGISAEMVTKELFLRPPAIFQAKTNGVN